MRSGVVSVSIMMRAARLLIKTVNKEVGGKRCFNCGERDHLSSKCPSKERGQKCFVCGEYGHVATKREKKTTTKTKDSCAVSQSGRRKCLKEVMLDDVKIEALIDSTSDLTLMRADEYVKRGSQRFELCKMVVRGIGAKEVTVLGKFEAKITVDGCHYPIGVYVISDTAIPYPFLISTDFLDKFEVNIRANKIMITPINDLKESSDNDLPEIFKIDVIDQKPDESDPNIVLKTRTLRSYAD